MVTAFNYFQSTDIRFGCGRVNEVGQIVAQFGKRCLLVTVPMFEAFAPVVEKVKKALIGGIHYGSWKSFC